MQTTPLAPDSPIDARALLRQELGLRPPPAEKPKADAQAEESAGTGGAGEGESDADEADTDPEEDEVPGGEESEDSAGEEDDEDNLTDEEKAALKMPERTQQRLAKLKEQREAARTEAETLKAEAARLREQVEQLSSAPVALTPTPVNPLGNVTTPEQLEKVLAAWQQELDWAVENAEGGTRPDGKGGEVELSAADVRALRTQAADVLKKHGPQRQAYLQAYAAADKAAKTAYPFLYQQGHPGSEYGLALLKEAPALAMIPDHGVVVGDAYVGALIRQGKANAVRDSKTGAVTLVPIPKPGAAAKPARTKPPEAKKSPPAAPAKPSSAKPDLAAALATGDPKAVLRAELGRV